jgi:molybdopterin/thiamine biosynthesis adenylyltransferase
MTTAAPETVTPPTQTPDQPQPGQVFWRQLDIVNPERLNEYSFVIIGAGSTGSWTAMNLAKLGAQHIQVWDADVINEHNAPCQVYGRQETGRRKIEALVDHVQRLTSSPIFGVAQMLDEKAVPTFDRNTVLVVCVDSMKARKYAWELAKRCPEIKLLIDPRLARETLRLYAINPQDPMHQAEYETSLYSDEEADGESIPCTAQAIVYTATFTASFVAAIVASFVNGEPFYNEIGFGCRTFKFIGSYF